ncbi:LuxR C-terminal-related transcriptional regulator [Diaphorobacter aerolatus]|uniref:Helix-turn-helix transcriptional regulator n=1 Tax=Diaphorobacter aerolatus TaxID=1288495 RepID=A0A7H0GJS1_9BURK|nr:LuxR C-terminal-related transcriptional regulator [Diaphorobacter aerolatus]QNP48537.1 helix-turn-helix transcriptional regulator [Diaphorobacter aerolatus]
MTSSRIPHLDTKLTPPATTPHQVMRQPAGLGGTHSSARVVLVRAPAGFGKSTAMMQYYRSLEAQGQSVAWLTLDSQDNDLSRFVHYLGEMMVRTGIATSHPYGPLEAVDGIAMHPSGFTFFMDELDALRSPAVLGLLRELIERLPRGGQIVVGCRSWPDLGFGRLRARGQLIEVGPPQLRFSIDETRSFLRNQLATLPEHAMLTLHERCEGWATGLWLASLALQHRPDAAVTLAERFSGSDQALVDYLAEDVLAHESPEVREFLLRTSVLRHLTAPICAALCPDIDCAAMLEHLSTRGVFLARVGNDPPTWRYHSLFASFLRARLEQRGANAAQALHLGASLAYEAERRPVPAIDHAVLANDQQRAITLLSMHAESFQEQGRLRLLDRWFQSLDAGLLLMHPRLWHLSLWANCFTRGPLETLSQMGLSDPMQEPEVTAEGSSAYLSLRAMLLALLDRYADAHAFGMRALAALPSDLPFADSALLNLMANISSILGVPEESRKLLDMARSRFGGSAFNRMYAESLEGILDLFEGRMRQASARFRIAVEATHLATFNQSHGNAWAGVLHAFAMYEANKLDKADHLLNIYLPMARDVGLPDHMILGHSLRARLAFQAGDVDAALHSLMELEHLGHVRHLPRLISASHLERARIYMQQGNSQSAHEELNRAAMITQPRDLQNSRLLAQDIEYPALAQLRWNACFGDAAGALIEASSRAAEAERHGRQRRALKLRLIQAMAEHRAGHHQEALQRIDALLHIACREGFVRLVLEEVPWIKPLLCSYLARTLEHDSSDNDPIFTEYLAQIRADAQISAEPDALQDTPTPLAEPLTRKELHVLQLLAEGYSNNAIAEKLVVADTTVRTHLRHINTKLNATSRTQAVALARRLRLIL